ncbi:hypothetical protein F383_13870 [Gossypium arboreum]|uniref:Uncharacterized protein n=1 Tax=Gossypium arboreum TaxID=29729 RepID=A0A0B0PS53_GOSAR|nr:hypothetical protein F383_06912 [Gossypium arboreum]KHG27825.1 hypothetical protein F383_13870 [Gossypium arboreum]
MPNAPLPVAVLTRSTRIRQPNRHQNRYWCKARVRGCAGSGTEVAGVRLHEG